MKMAAVIGLLGLQRGESFELFSNRDDAGNFDDIVYTADGRRYFLQLKHADNPDKNNLTEKSLVTLLQKCFISYCHMKNGNTFKDIPFDSSEFIIYTNKELEPTLLKHKRRQREVDIFFKTSDKGEIFSFLPDKNSRNDVYTQVENATNQSKEFRNSRNREIVTEFLNKLIIATGQKGQRELDEVIDKEIRKHSVVKVDNEVYKTELLEFKTGVELWCRDKNKKMTATMFRIWLQEAKTKACASVVRTLFNSCTMELGGKGIKFSASEISWLQAKLSNKRAVHLRSDALTLCSILLLDCPDTSKCIFVTFESLQSNKNMLLHAWLGGHWERLTVLCDSTVRQSDISDTCLEIFELIKGGRSSKSVIILTACSVQQIRNFFHMQHKFKFEQLSAESQEIVLDKKIGFQGCEVTLRSVLQQHGNVQHVLGPELVTDLITEGTTVNIGVKLQENEDYYAPRVLERKLWLHTNFLRNARDIIVVSGTKEEDLVKNLSSGKTVESFSMEDINKIDFTQDMSGSIFVLSDTEMENSFQAICEKFEGRTLHWVEFKNGAFLWKKSRGSTDSLLDYIDATKSHANKRIVAACMKSGSCEVNEESIWNVAERTVLVVAEPGMGKSSTTTQVAWNTKLADPTSWVVRINWNDHTRKLQEIDTATFNFDSLVEFLCSASFPKSKYTDINRILLKQALQNSGNVTVLMDGFDEICPTHADKAAVILSELMKTKVRRVWVTSRPVQKDRLERKLSVIAFSMKTLSRESQEKLLSYLWLDKDEETGVKSKLCTFVKNFLSKLNQSVRDNNFTGSPLYITMIASVYEKHMKEHLNSEDLIWPNIKLLILYEEFVGKKILIYVTDKKKVDVTNSCVLDDHEEEKAWYLKNFEKCALVAILPPSMLKSLHDRKIEEEIQPFLDKVQAGKDKTGVVMNVVEGKPQFVHQTFAEYFTALWFSRNFESNRSVLERILFDPEYDLVRYMFHRMLARSSPVHCAAIERDRQRFEDLLQQGSDVSVVDKGGRTVMHIIAQIHGLRTVNPEFYIKVSLDNTDSVLQWTPMQYAIQSENWYIVERLLERKVDRSGLDMIRQRAKNRYYIDAIVMDSAEHCLLIVLQYLWSIGVNIHQASSVRFPSPLHAAVFGRELRAIRWLIQYGVDCNNADSDGQTPLFLAVSEGLPDVVRVLVEEGGASVEVSDNDGRTAIDLAKRKLLYPRNYEDSNDHVQKCERIVEYLQYRVHGRSICVCLRTDASICVTS